MNIAASYIVGVISDTHGLLRPEACEALEGVDHILHAGDIGSEEVLDKLRGLAPVSAVRGNNDRDAWAMRIPETSLLNLGDKRVYLLHSIADLAIDPAAEGISAVVSGHSHRPSITQQAGVLYLNPGSAGPRRFSLPVTIAKLVIGSGNLTAEIVPLNVQEEERRR